MSCAANVSDMGSETERTLATGRMCTGCGVPLTGRRPQARYCSDRCRTRGGREAHRRRIAGLLDTITDAADALRRELGFLGDGVCKAEGDLVRNEEAQ